MLYSLTPTDMCGKCLNEGCSCVQDNALNYVCFFVCVIVFCHSNIYGHIRRDELSLRSPFSEMGDSSQINYLRIDTCWLVLRHLA